MFTLSVTSSIVTVSRFGTIKQLVEVGSNDPTRINQWFNPAESRKLDALEQLKCLGLLPGDTVLLSDSGELISFSPSVEVSGIRCPYCQTPIRSIGSLLVCSNATCRGRQAARLEHFCSEQAFNIPGAKDLSYASWADLICRQPRIKSLASMFSAHVAHDLAGAIGDPLALQIATTMNFLKTQLGYSRNAPIAKAMLMTLLESMSIPGLTWRTFQVLTSGVDMMTEDVPPLSMVAACMEQPEILFRFSNCPEEVAFLSRDLDPFYVSEFRDIVRYVIGQS